MIFLFADTQIADEMFIEDINTVLNTADVPNLYAPDEKADILEKMQTAARDSVSNFLEISLKCLKISFSCPDQNVTFQF